MTGASDSEAREFAASFRSFLEWVHSEQTERSEVAALVDDFLGDGASERSVVTRALPVFEHVNLRTSL
jgi:cell division protease FtsH